MNMKKLAFFLLLTAIFPVTIVISAVSVTLRTFYEFNHELANNICSMVDKVAAWADK